MARLFHIQICTFLCSFSLIFLLQFSFTISYFVIELLLSQSEHLVDFLCYSWTLYSSGSVKLLNVKSIDVTWKHWHYVPALFHLLVLVTSWDNLVLLSWKLHQLLSDVNIKCTLYCIFKYLIIILYYLFTFTSVSFCQCLLITEFQHDAI